jgi:predicted acetyltransferase
MSPKQMKFRKASLNDCLVLAKLNHQLIRDEGHRNTMTIPELEQRMRNWIESDYSAILFEDGPQLVAYALFREQPHEIYLRQLFVVRNLRRQGFGRKAMQILLSEVWPKNKRLTVEVLIKNTTAVTFWRAMGYSDYALTLEIMPKSFIQSGITN